MPSIILDQQASRRPLVTVPISLPPLFDIPVKVDQGTLKLKIGCEGQKAGDSNSVLRVYNCDATGPTALESRGPVPLTWTQTRGSGKSLLTAVPVKSSLVTTITS